MQMNTPTENTLIKQCRVCGDRAIGFNFNVVSCESCKSFFRRHALRHNNELFCQKDNNCQIDRRNRANCKSCRMHKCLMIGMKKDLILSRGNRNEETNYFHHQNTHHFTQMYKNSTELKAVEYERLMIARIAVSAFWNENSFEVRGEASDVVQICNLGAYTIRQTIKFCKSFPAFQSLSQDDQLVLLKSFYPEKTAVRVAFLYDEHEDGFIGVDSVENESEGIPVFVRMSTFRQWKHSNLYSILRSFVRSLHRQMENDPTIRDLILAQLLFKPRLNLTAPEYIRYHHILNCYLLRRYLEHKYADTKKATRKYCAMIRLLKRIDLTSETMRSVYNKVQQSSHLEEVLVEIYN